MSRRSPILFTWQTIDNQVEGYLVTCRCQNLHLTETDGEANSFGTVDPNKGQAWAEKLAEALEKAEVVTMAAFGMCKSASGQHEIQTKNILPKQGQCSDLYELHKTKRGRYRYIFDDKGDESSRLTNQKLENRLQSAVRNSKALSENISKKNAINTKIRKPVANNSVAVSQLASDTCTSKNSSKKDHGEVIPGFLLWSVPGSSVVPQLNQLKGFQNVGVRTLMDGKNTKLFILDHPRKNQKGKESETRKHKRKEDEANSSKSGNCSEDDNEDIETSSNTCPSNLDLVSGEKDVEKMENSQSNVTILDGMYHDINTDFGMPSNPNTAIPVYLYPSEPKTMCKDGDSLVMNGETIKEKGDSNSEPTVAHTDVTNDSEAAEKDILHVIHSIMNLDTQTLLPISNSTDEPNDKLNPKKVASSVEVIRNLKEEERKKMFKTKDDIQKRSMDLLMDGGKAFLCDVCGLAFTIYSYKKHMITHSREPRERSHICHICGKGFMTVEYLRHHVKKHSDELPYECRHCDKKYKTLYGRTIHERGHFNVMLFKCDECGMEFGDSNGYRSHQGRHHSPRYKPKRRRRNILNPEESVPLKDGVESCKICGKQLKSLSVPSHMRTHSEETFTCPICHKTMAFQTKYSHMKYHQGKKDHKCDHCGKTFVMKQALNVHLRTHTGERPIPCRYCNKTYPTYQSREIHERSHTGERPYECDLCNKAWKDRPTYIQHMKRKHPGRALSYKRKTYTSPAVTAVDNGLSHVGAIQQQGMSSEPSQAVSSDEQGGLQQEQAIPGAIPYGSTTQQMAQPQDKDKASHTLGEQDKGLEGILGAIVTTAEQSHPSTGQQLMVQCMAPVQGAAGEQQNGLEQIGQPQTASKGSKVGNTAGEGREKAVEGLAVAKQPHHISTPFSEVQPQVTETCQHLTQPILIISEQHPQLTQPGQVDQQQHHHMQVAQHQVAQHQVAQHQVAQHQVAQHHEHFITQQLSDQHKQLQQQHLQQQHVQQQQQLHQQQCITDQPLQQQHHLPKQQHHTYQQQHLSDQPQIHHIIGQHYQLPEQHHQIQAQRHQLQEQHHHHLTESLHHLPGAMRELQESHHSIINPVERIDM